MNVIIRTAIGVTALGFSVLSSSAQTFLGSDNFNDNTLTLMTSGGVTIPQAVGQWRIVDDSESSGTWTEPNQGMEYTTPVTSGFDRSFLYWVSGATSYNRPASGNNLGIGGTGLPTGNPYTSSWVAQVEVTNNLTSLSTGWSNTGLQLFSSGSNGFNAYYTISVNTAPGAIWIVPEWGVYNVGTDDFTTHINYIATNDSTNVLLQMSFNADTKVLVASYSNDGGSTFLTGATYDLDGAEAGYEPPLNGGFALELLTSVNNIGSAVTSGQMSFDNLSVSAVPEPSTYAALAGLGALGFAVWRRRRKA